MKTLLIAEHSEAITDALIDSLGQDWDIYTCADGYTAIDIIRRHNPDALIINLCLLSKDGLSVLETCFPAVPPIILALSAYTSPYIQQISSNLGVGYILPIPCTISTMVNRLNSMYDTYYNAPTFTARHLQSIGIDCKHNGYHYLVYAIQLFSSNKDLRLHKELYAEIVSKCGATNEACVERAIRTAIKAAWAKRKNIIWKYYFTTDKCPSNKEFIARFAELLSLASVELSFPKI